MEDQVFAIRPDEFQITVNGKVLPAVFNSKGAALAGLQVEQRRATKKSLGKAEVGLV